ncbi:MAG: hypothetical protein WC319_15420 [Candidatus Paceibacterota bacterium]|jgi:hypothetical protein
MRKKIVRIENSYGGPCIYKEAIFEDGTRSGCVQCTGQSDEEMEELFYMYADQKKDDCRAFVDSITAGLW